MQQISMQSKSFLQNRFFVLLTSILLLIIVGPFLQEHAVTKWLVGLTSIAILGGVIYSVKEKTRYLKLFAALASITIILSFFDLYTNMANLHIAYTELGMEFGVIPFRLCQDFNFLQSKNDEHSYSM